MEDIGDWNNGEDEHLDADVNEEFNMENGQNNLSENGEHENGQNVIKKSDEKELYRQILVSKLRRDYGYDDERLGRIVAGANADGIIEHIDRVRAACVGPYNRDRNGHAGVEIYVENKEDYLRLLYHGVDDDGVTLRLYPKVQRIVKKIYNIQISGLPLAIEEKEVRQMTHWDFKQHDFDILEAKRDAINLGNGLLIPSNRYSLKVRMRNPNHKILRNDYERVKAYWNDSVQRFFVQQNINAQVTDDVPEVVPVAKRIFSRFNGEPTNSSGRDCFADEGRDGREQPSTSVTDSTKQQTEPQQQSPTLTQDLTQTPFPETQDPTNNQKPTLTNSSQELTLTTQEATITTITTTAETQLTPAQPLNSPSFASKVRDGPGPKDRLKMAEGRSRMILKAEKGKYGKKRGSETKHSDQEQYESKRGDNIVESNSDGTEDLVIDTTEGRAAFVQGIMAAELQCPDEVFEYKENLSDGEEVRRSLVMQLVDPRSLRNLPAYLVEHERAVWVADVNIYKRLAALLQDVVGIYAEMEEVEEQFCRTVILEALHPKVGEEWKSGVKDENFNELINYYNEYGGRVRKDEG